MTMLEKIARAIFANHNFCYDSGGRMFDGDSFEDLDDMDKADFVNLAHAVLTSLRESAPEFGDYAYDVAIEKCHESIAIASCPLGEWAAETMAGWIDAAIEEGKDK